MGTIQIQLSTYAGNTAWVFPMKDSELERRLRAIGLGSAGEIPIISVGWPEGLHVLNGLSVNADELNFLAKSIERFDYSEYDQFLAAVSIEKNPDIERLINLSFNINHYTVIRDVADLAGIGEYHLMNTRGSLSKTELETIDFAQVGRDLLSSGKGVPTEYGLLFENEEVPFQQVYDGTTFPPYVYKADVVAIVNMHYKGKTEYLYLPEEDISIEKALKRLDAPCLSDCTMEMEMFSCPDKCWQDRLETNFEIAGLQEANYLAEILTRKNLDLDKLLLADWGFEVLDYELYGKVDVRLTEPMTEEEENELREWIHGQNSDGLGEGYEQQEIVTDRGNLYVSFWDNGAGYFIKDSEEMNEYLGHSGQQFGGM